jgi:hypothetical protein
LFVPFQVPITKPSYKILIMLPVPFKVVIVLDVLKVILLMGWVKVWIVMVFTTSPAPL